MFQKGDSLTNKMDACFLYFFQQILRQNERFVLTQENTYLWRFHFKANRKNIDSLKKRF